VNRRTIAVVTATVAVLSAAATTTTALRHRGGRHSGTVAVRAPGPAGTADARTVDQKAEDTFLGATAVHLCNVQSTVFDDPAALAAAYSAAPTYPGLTADQVKALQDRLTSDSAFGARLTRQLRSACRHHS
jgi:hypothetical protein